MALLFMLCLALLASLGEGSRDADVSTLLQLAHPEVNTSKNVVVVSGCVTDASSKYSGELCTIVERNLKQYCGYHGYGLNFFNQKLPGAEHREATWSKIIALQTVLEEPSVEYVFWMDSDSLFMNLEKRLEDLIPKEGADFSASPGKQCFLNGGHLMFKNTAWTRKFLEDVWNTFPPPAPWEEQSAMIYNLWKYSEGSRTMNGDDAGNDSIFLTTSSRRSSMDRASAAECRRHTRAIDDDPLGCCNGTILKELSRKELGVVLLDQRPMREMDAFEYNFEPGDLIIHLAGGSLESKMAKMQMYEENVLDPRSSSRFEDFSKLMKLKEKRARFQQSIPKEVIERW